MIRPAAQSDHAAILDMMEIFNRGERIDMRRETWGPALSRLIADPRLGRLLVVDEGGLCGYAVVTWGFDFEFGGRDAFLTELYVAESRRKSGLGRKLLDGVLAAARDEGAGAVHLGVYPDNAPALALYRAMGFTKIPRDFYSVGT
jgi:ribosomal protein S18 acetylase RimI-like enzyme